MTQHITIRAKPLLIVLAPRAPLFKRNLNSPMASKLTPRKMGEVDSSRPRNLGAPNGGSYFGGAFEVLTHLTHSEIIGRMIFLAWASTVP